MNELRVMRIEMVWCFIHYSSTSIVNHHSYIFQHAAIISYNAILGDSQNAQQILSHTGLVVYPGSQALGMESLGVPE